MEILEFQSERTLIIGHVRRTREGDAFSRVCLSMGVPIPRCTGTGRKEALFPMGRTRLYRLISPNGARHG